VCQHSKLTQLHDRIHTLRRGDVHVAHDKVEGAVLLQFRLSLEHALLHVRDVLVDLMILRRELEFSKVDSHNAQPFRC